jgi:hypothetical protein
MLKYATCICYSQMIKKLIYSDEYLQLDEFEQEVTQFNPV